MSADEALAWAHAHLPKDPNDVVGAMKQAGWEWAGGRVGLYVRLRLPGEEKRSAIVPLDPSMGDYPDLMAGLLADLVLRAEAGHRAQQVLGTLASERAG
jgi:hypothetical protein